MFCDSLLFEPLPRFKILMCVCVYTQRTNILPQTSCAWILNSPESAALSVK